MAESAPDEDTRPMTEIVREMNERNAVSRDRVLLAIERLRAIREERLALAEAELRRRRRWRLF
jgi:hypothetical protein